MMFTITKDVITVTLEKSLYNESVVFKCFYWYTNQYQVRIFEKDINYWMVELKTLQLPLSKELIDQLQHKIQQDLIDFKLRDIVSTETKTIRELLAAKAFAHYETEEGPSTDISDPVGFNPENVIAHDKSFE